MVSIRRYKIPLSAATGGREGELKGVSSNYNFCSILVVKRMGAEYMRGRLFQITLSLKGNQRGFSIAARI